MKGIEQIRKRNFTLFIAQGLVSKNNHFKVKIQNYSIKKRAKKKATRKDSLFF